MELIQQILTNPAVLWGIAIVLAAVITALLKRNVNEKNIYPLLVFIANLIFSAEIDYSGKDGAGEYKKDQVLRELNQRLDIESKAKLNKKFGNLGKAVEFVFDKVKPSLHTGFKNILGSLLKRKLRV